MKRIYPLFLILLLLAVWAPVASASSGAATITYIELIIDCSDTMKRDIGGMKKLDAAKAAVIDFINNAPKDYQFALRVMGGDENATYYSSNLITSMGFQNKFDLIKQIKALKPAGQRSLYNALLECTYDFSSHEGNNVAIVITDGLDDGGQSLDTLEPTYEYTPGAPRLYIFGLDITESMESEFNALISASGGKLISLDDATLLKDAMQSATSELGGNLTVFIYNEYGVPVKGDIVVYDAGGTPVFAGYDVSSINKDLTPGIYNVTATYSGEVQNQGPVDISPGGGQLLKFSFIQHNGNVRITLVDSLNGSLKGYITVKNLDYETVYSGGPESNFLIALPSGQYEIEAEAGGRTYLETGVMVEESGMLDLEIVIPVMQAVLEVEVNNTQSQPINGRIQIYTADGFLMGEANHASYYQLSLPPDTYTVSVQVGAQRYEKTASIAEGDQFTLDFDIAVEMGTLLIELRTESGHEAWGVVRVYDAVGQYQRQRGIESDESPDWALELPEGTYRIEAEVEGVVSTRDGIIVKGNEETRITMTFPDYVG